MTTTRWADLRDPAKALPAAREAAAAQANRMECLRRNADPADDSLRQLLEELERECRVVRDAVEEYGRRSGLPASPTFSGNGMIREAFPSFMKTKFGETPLDRDLALHFAELAMQEAARFYLRLSRAAREHEMRSFFSGLAQRFEEQWVHLQKVLL